MKIAEAEELIVSEGLSDELFAEFKQALKRVPKNQRCQHCYIVAYELRTKQTDKRRRRKNFKDAVALIEYGIENHPERDTCLRMAYEHLGMAYGDAEEYESAKIHLQTARSIAGDGYIPYFAYLIVRMELHAADFTCTPHLRELYGQMLDADEFQASRRINIFYRSLTEIVIANESGDREAKKSACERALSALEADKFNPLDGIFMRHRAADLNKVRVTKKALAFLKKNLR